jgi:hypothetical protein
MASKTLLASAPQATDRREHLAQTGPRKVAAWPISIEFGESVPALVRSRITYAFRVFAAISGHTVVEPLEAERRVVYGASGRSGDFHVPALYELHLQKKCVTGFEQVSHAGETFYLSLGRDKETGNPDWLGELFLWLSGSYEIDVAEQDPLGRVPFSATVFHKYGIPVTKPHASMLIGWMAGALSGNQPGGLAVPHSPDPSGRHLVVISHDVDYYDVGRSAALRRLLKNLLIAATVYRNRAYFGETLALLAALASGKPIGRFFPTLGRELAEREMSSTLFVVSRKAHRRDPNYQFEQIVPHLRGALRDRFSIGLHGSYESVMGNRLLPEEARRLQERLGLRPVANRQHWLRFRSQRQLFTEVARTGVPADSSLGFPGHIGFRNGAAFAYPPYDFSRERAYDFLEVPLAVMDGALEAASRRAGSAQQRADQILAESRRYGWGGIALLWHNPVEALAVPGEINQVFWNCARLSSERKERWLGFDQFLDLAVERYRKAGFTLGW